jgi:putative exosortase-associated protein (TIGR04073 family)
MREKKRMVVLAAVMACSVLSARAGYLEGAVHKLGRGLGNVIGIPVEVLLNIESVSEERGYVAGGTYGLTRGVYHGVVRGLVGVYEVATFIVPQEPIVHPEFVMDPTTSDEYEWDL